MCTPYGEYYRRGLADSVSAFILTLIYKGRISDLIYVKYIYISVINIYGPPFRTKSIVLGGHFFFF